MFVFATVHGFTSGADNKNLAIQWVALTGGLAVFLLVTFRVLAPRRARSADRAASRTRVAAATHVAPVPAPAAPTPAPVARPQQPDAAALLGRSAETAAKVAELAELAADGRVDGNPHTALTRAATGGRVSRTPRPTRSGSRAGARRASRGTACSRSRRHRRRIRPSGSRCRTRPCPTIGRLSASDAADPRNHASNANTPPSVATSQYPDPSGSGTIERTGARRRVPPVDPRNRASPNDEHSSVGADHVVTVTGGRPNRIAHRRVERHVAQVAEEVRVAERVDAPLRREEPVAVPATRYD